MTANPPKKPGVCDVDAAALIQREDDKEATVRERMRTYRQKTAPLIEYYRQRGLLREVVGEGEVEAITQRVEEAVSA